MRYQLLGHSGLKVSEVCLGAMTFGDDWAIGVGRDESRRVFDTFAEAGGNFVDTAVNYTEGTSEKLVGEFIRSQREHFVLATKYTGTRQDQTDLNQGGNSRKNMMQSVERSLKQLGTDYIDLYYVHFWDEITPIEEVMRALDDLVRAGKILYVGVSDSPAWLVSESNMLAELRGWSRYIAYQLPYSLAWRDIERAELQVARRWDMAVVPWSILDAGSLSGKYSRGETGTRWKAENISPEKRRIIDAVDKMAKELGRTPSQVAVNWVRQQSLAQMIPLLGARSAEQLKDNLGALDWKLTGEQLETLNASNPISLGFPRDALEGGFRSYHYGQMYGQFDDHRKGRR